MINILAALLITLQTTSEVEQLLTDRAQVHGASVGEVLRVSQCENRNLTPGLVNYAGSGAIGIGQWLPGRGNHWDRTPAWREHRIDIHQVYRAGDINALYYDVDMFAWSFGREAPAGNKRGWSCY